MTASPTLIEALRADTAGRREGECQNCDAGLKEQAADALEGLLGAVREAKRGMWITARHEWTLADFKNWAVIQQIDAAIAKAESAQ